MNPNLSDEPRPRTRRTGPNPLYTILQALASLKITVALFAISVVLVFFGTLAQKNTGIWTVVDDYFYSWFVKIDLNLPVQLGQVFLNFPSHWRLEGWIPFPAGKLIGWAMLFNLLAAHALRFKLTWKRSGIFILHAGVITLLLGEWVTREYQVEQRMVIEEHSSSNYAFDTRSSELAFVSPGEGNTEKMTVIPGSQLVAALASKRRISHPDVPVDVEVLEYWPNSKRIKTPYATDAVAIREEKIRGYGLRGSIESVPEVSGTDPNQIVDRPATVVRLFEKAPREGTGLVATIILGVLHVDAEPIEVAGQKFDVDLRWTRHYKPYRIHAEKLTHEKYPGTQIPKAFISRVRIEDPEHGVDREVEISMNEPLRYRGEAYFQSGFDEGETKTTSLQVVRNPGWTLPYISCALVTLGMLVHFGIFLVQYLRRLKPVGDIRPSESTRLTAPPVNRAIRYAPLFAALFVGLYFAGNLFHRTTDGDLDLTAVGTVPVQEGGRYKPLDTAARTGMRQINKRETYINDNGKERPALKWYLEASTFDGSDDHTSFQQRIFRIENMEVLALLGLERREGWRYSLGEFAKKLPKLSEEATTAGAVLDKDRTPYQAKVLELANNIQLHQKIIAGVYPSQLPPLENDDWRNYGASLSRARRVALQAMLQEAPELGQAQSEKDFDRIMGTLPEEVQLKLYRIQMDAMKADEATAKWGAVLSAYKSGNQKKLDDAVVDFKKVSEEKLTPGQRFRIKFEAFLNGFAPFYHNTVIYGLTLVLCLVGWCISIGSPKSANTIRKAVFWMLFVNFLVHGFSLISRMYLMERPLVFVTNLYSSAVFIGCAAVAVSLLLEVIYPLSLGNLVASALGLTTCIIAHQIAESGDTLEMMRAVLDTNFWLATHVTTVTFGYSATYIAGAIGLIYLVLALFTRHLQRPVVVGADGKEQPVGKLIGQALYGIICTAMLFSFVGTVLGGIWADQSWGRFWGWDPKENGAVLIVLWNALILHARWAGLVKTRGVAILALVGNMVTTWSWFGTNQLGVGLHAYGFSNALAFFCVLVWGSHLAIIGIALCVPNGFWKTENKKA